ncbi:MAG: NAD(P)-dependent alcohol dehydrogenase [Proteobacteria bacterium]|nr:NAD(P)-dependent alcohol dehydrogenase [Pseudomonadota bacterium]
MRAAFIQRHGAIGDVVRVDERPEPVPSGGQVLIEVAAATVNPRDYLLVEGRYVFSILAGRLPLVLGSDVAGTVVGLGPRAVGFAVGDEVLGMQTPRGRFGGFAERVAIRSGAVARKPPALPFEQAAGLGVAGITALQALRDDAELRAGEHVVVVGASGGVGSFAVQLAKHTGARVTGVCSGGNVELARRLGCDDVIDYTTADFRERVRDADVVFDTIGRERLATVRPCLRPGGRYVTTVPTAGNTKDQAIGSTLGRLRRGAPRSRTVICKARSRDLQELADLAAAGELEVLIDSRHPLEDAAEALRRSKSRRARGKIVITIG